MVKFKSGDLSSIINLNLNKFEFIDDFLLIIFVVCSFILFFNWTKRNILDFGKVIWVLCW